VRARVWTIVACLLMTAAWLGGTACRTAAPAPVPQVWAATGATWQDTDSLTSVTLEDGSVRVFATSKGGDRVHVLDGDTGKLIADYTGGDDGLRYPNGIATVDFTVGEQDGRPRRRPCILVVERDHARVHALWGDTLAPAGTFGADELHKPYGIAVSHRDDRVLVYVTDTNVAPDWTVQVYELARSGERVSGRPVRRFGAASGPGVIRVAESVLVDDQHDRVFLCNEDDAEQCVKVYDREGRFTGPILAAGLIRGEAEGIALYPQGDGDGVLIVTDQQKTISIWHIYDRRTLAHRGAFTGAPTVANTDGICVHVTPFGPFTGGALFAVHDDLEVRAYDMAAVLKAVARR